MDFLKLKAGKIVYLRVYNTMFYMKFVQSLENAYAFL